MTLQQQYNLINEGKGDKAHFLKNAKFQFPNLFNAFTSYEDSVNVLKGKGLIAESTNGVGGVVTGGREQDWVKIFKQSISEEVKAEEKKTSKEVEDVLAHTFNYKDDKNIDNVYGQAFLHGFYTEIQDPKNEAKTVDEVKEIVRKNLSNNPLHYTEDGMFGLKGVGYVTEFPGLGTPKEPKGKYKSSGYGDLREGMYGNSDGDYDEQEDNKARAYWYYDAYLGEKDPKKKAEYAELARKYASYLGWGEEDLPGLEGEEPENTFLEPGKKQTFEPIPREQSQAHTAGDKLRASIARSTKIDKLKEAIREMILQELGSITTTDPNQARDLEKQGSNVILKKQ